MSNKIVFYKIVLYVLVCFFISGFLACPVAQKEYDGKIQKLSFFTSQNTDNSPQGTGKDDDTKPSDKPDTDEPPQDTGKDDDTKPNDKPDTDEPSKASGLYLISGFASGIQTSDVWNSEDGVMWSEINTSGEKFTDRYGHQVVFFQDKLYLIGGYDLNDFHKNDVWSSRDGVMWKQETAEAQFSARTNYRVVVFKNKLYLIGGYVFINDSFVAKNDIWSSTDGVRWEEVRTDGDTFSPRSGHQVVVFQGKMFVIGGNDAGEYKNDVWSSSDGVMWRQMTAGAKFSVRYGHQVVVFQGKMYLIGGRNAGGGQNDIWSTSNGVTWSNVNATRPIFTAHEGHQVVVFRNKMYFIGGRDDSGGNTNDVWSSYNGVTWRQEETVKGKNFPDRSLHQVVVFPAE